MESNLRIIENDLVPVYETSTGEKVVYGSDLHKVLGVKSNYREWSIRRFKDCDASETADYQGVEISTPGNPTPKKDHIILLDTAKEMAMLERNDMGKKVRRYFIEIEKKYKQQPQNMNREQLMAMAFLEANKIIDEQKQLIEQKDKLIEEQKPLVEFATHVGEASNCIDVGQLAKIANKQGIDIGRARLFTWLKKNKYLMNDNTPYQRYINNGLFKVIETTKNTSYGPMVFPKTLITGKGQIYIVEKLKEENKLISDGS